MGVEVLAVGAARGAPGRLRVGTRPRQPGPEVSCGLTRGLHRSSGLPTQSRSIAEMTEKSWPLDVAVMGGCGHVGLPLGISLAESGLSVGLYDVDLGAVDSVGSGKMAHWEPGAPEVLERVLEQGRLSVSADASILGTAEHVIVVLSLIHI